MRLRVRWWQRPNQRGSAVRSAEMASEKKPAHGEWEEHRGVALAILALNGEACFVVVPDPESPEEVSHRFTRTIPFDAIEVLLPGTILPDERGSDHAD